MRVCDDDAGEAPLQPFMLPEGRVVAAVPTAAQLDRTSPDATSLDGREILFNWAVVGWCVGRLKINVDGRRRVKCGGEKVCPNFWAYYEVDQQETPHFLTSVDYGQSGGAGAWVLLD